MVLGDDGNPGMFPKMKYHWCGQGLHVITLSINLQIRGFQSVGWGPPGVLEGVPGGHLQNGE